MTDDDETKTIFDFFIEYFSKKCCFSLSLFLRLHFRSSQPDDSKNLWSYQLLILLHNMYHKEIHF